ncbi:transcriptional regulator [Sagittula sp. NFXS13]|uniref:sugar-binding transcriptional regulator n=1 Tax=Sagittula sp. NFXS13 TaxID=2819095 RepID=UPI0032DFB3FF
MSKRRILDRSLMHMAARLHYVDGLSQRDVAKKLDISTASASRVLARAREEGVVQIKVADIFETDALGAKLAAALGLRAASVCESIRPHDMAYRVSELLREGDLPGSPVIAIGWGRTIKSVLMEGLPKLPGSSIVPCIGGMEETEPHFQINELVRLAAESTGGQAMFLHAPYLASKELRGVLERDPKSRRVFESWSKVDAAIFGIGSIAQAAYIETLHFGETNRARVVGDVARRYYDIEGIEVLWDGEEDLMAIPRLDMRRIPLSIGVAAGHDKADAILGAVRSGMVNALVTDSATASDLLASLNVSPDGQ